MKKLSEFNVLSDGKTTISFPFLLRFKKGLKGMKHATHRVTIKSSVHNIISNLKYLDLIVFILNLNSTIMNKLLLTKTNRSCKFCKTYLIINSIKKCK